MKKNTKKSKMKKGFSLVEVLLSTLIFSIGLVSVAVLMLNSLKGSVDSRNTVIASQLAQEGVELIRNFRDNNLAFGKAAFAGINIAGVNNCPHIGGSVSNILEDNSCPGTPFPQGQIFHTSNGYEYTFSVDNATPFLRKVTVTDSDPHVVRSMVIWGGTTFPVIANCTVSNKCVYVDLALNETGWK